MSPSLPHWMAFWAVGEPDTSFYDTLLNHRRIQVVDHRLCG